MNYDTDIAIVGAGLNGAMMSLALAEAGFTVTLIDPQTLKSKQNPHFDGRSYSLAIASVRLMQALGLWEELAPNAQPILEIKVADGRAYSNPSPYFLHFDHHEIEEGPMGHMVEDRHLRPLLQKRLQSVSQINYRAGLSVSEMTITDTHAELRLNTEETLTTRLVIGADGRQSQTAERAGIKRTGWRYGQTALVCALSHNIPHQGVACQYFMPPGPLAILPLTGNRSSIVWTLPMTLMAGPGGFVAYALTKGTYALTKQVWKLWAKVERRGHRVSLLFLYIGAVALSVMMVCWVLVFPSSWFAGNSAIHDWAVTKLVDGKQVPLSIIQKYNGHPAIQFMQTRASNRSIEQNGPHTRLVSSFIS